VLYVVSPDIAGLPENERKIEDLGEIGNLRDYSEQYKEALVPT